MVAVPVRAAAFPTAPGNLGFDGCGVGFPIYAELTLFVSGASARSTHAIAFARALCEVQLQERCLLNIVDVNTNPAGFDRAGATPSLVRDWPLPTRRVIGDLSDSRNVLFALDLRPATATDLPLIPC